MAYLILFIALEFLQILHSPPLLSENIVGITCGIKVSLIKSLPNNSWIWNTYFLHNLFHEVPCYVDLIINQFTKKNLLLAEKQVAYPLKLYP